MAIANLTGVVLDGRYRVLEPIATGAMGVVYRAERVKLGRAVAVKFLHAQLADDPDRRKRFEIEARAMARLDHPHCAAVIDVGVHGGMPYLVMDFIEGPTLRDVLDEGRLQLPRAAALIRQILWGLAHAHALDIVHRDVKPANVMLPERIGPGEQARLLDFGLARLQESSGLTAGMAIGTPAYMAPEQIAGDHGIDARTDLYACGVLLFEMLAGAKPFVADDAVEVLRLQLHATPPRLSEVAPGAAPPALDDVIARALAKAPDQRYGSAMEMAGAIDAALAPALGPARGPASGAFAAAETITPAPPLAARLASHRRWLAPAAVTALVVLIGLVARCAG